MANQDELASVLNDLIKINNDRVEGYQTAMEETKDTDVDLKAICRQMADQSMKYVNELTQEVARLGEDATTNTTLSGKVYRVWMDLKAAVSGHSKKSVLENCEFGEDVAQKAYELALESDSYMTTEIRQLIANQKSELKTSHDVIRNYRDVQEKVS
ncbi:MAG: PA2169 family four-helix-bundle protein [Chitinophagaceae bacterium]|nr:PA2169 family four-helix-bundle protein [Chitinophagaceae bacterium]